MKNITEFLLESLATRKNPTPEAEAWVDNAFFSHIAKNLKIVGNKISGKCYELCWEPYISSWKNAGSNYDKANGVDDIPDSIDISGLDFTLTYAPIPPESMDNYKHIIKRLFNGDFKFGSLESDIIKSVSHYTVNELKLDDFIIPCNKVDVHTPVSMNNLEIRMSNPNKKRAIIDFRGVPNLTIDDLTQLKVKGHVEKIILWETPAGVEMTKNCREYMNDPEKLSEYLNGIFKNFEDVRYVQTATARDTYENDRGEWSKY
jgi:hypothetical protein